MQLRWARFRPETHKLLPRRPLPHFVTGFLYLWRCSMRSRSLWSMRRKTMVKVWKLWTFCATVSQGLRHPASCWTARRLQLRNRRDRSPVDPSDTSGWPTFSLSHSFNTECLSFHNCDQQLSAQQAHRTCQLIKFLKMKQRFRKKNYQRTNCSFVLSSIMVMTLVIDIRFVLLCFLVSLPIICNRNRSLRSSRYVADGKLLEKR